jgi:molybdopterin-guanine dinucleotide biosynthesis protein A
MDSEIKYTGIILAGGKSSRIEIEKPLVLFYGKPLIKHVNNTLIPFYNQIPGCSADKIYNINGLTEYAAYFGNNNKPEDLANAN